MLWKPLHKKDNTVLFNIVLNLQDNK
uniref:Uncharacterized protein n=1 Tax=Anguilla anguilla TaxID=7936 RepID=A0A0E9R3N7_ANGAN